MSVSMVECLLPNSIVIPLSCCQDIQLSSLKKLLWLEAKKYPLFNALCNFDEYFFVGVNVDTEQEEYWDETLKLSDLRLFSPFLKLVEPGAKPEANVDHKISLAIGSDVLALDNSKDEEIRKFRKTILNTVSDAISTRQKNGMESLILYQHPPELEPSPHLPHSVKSLLDDSMLTLNIWLSQVKSIFVKVSWDIYPDGIISEALSNIPEDEEIKSSLTRGPAGYALKICGTNEYLLANRPVTQYKTIRIWIGKGRMPHLFLMPRVNLYSSYNKFTFVTPSSTAGNERLVEPDKKFLSLWHPSIEGSFKVHILKAFNIPVKSNICKYYIRIGLYHGIEQLCPIVESLPINSSPMRWGEWVQLEIPIQEVPRASRLCFSICSRAHHTSEKKRKKSREEDVMIGWGNIHLFDFEDRLIHGHCLVTLLSPPPGLEGLLHQQGTTHAPGFMLNSKEMQLGLEFEERFNQSIFFPDDNQIQDYARYIIKLDRRSSKVSCDENLERMSAIYQRDPCGTMSEEEITFIWNNRDICHQIPDSLPILLRAMEWKSRDQVCQLYLLLEDWPLLSPETALELLQFTYPDQKVRDHAITSLAHTLPDEKLAQYLLQLVHTLKHEAYLDSPLLRFILHKSLTNKNLGYYFFWHLRSEISVWPDPMRVLAILEAHCRGLGPDLKTLSRQVAMIEKMSKLADSVKHKRFDSNKERDRHLQSLLVENEFSHALQHLPSPLRPSLSLGRLRISECKVLESARKPICLVWDNSDIMAKHFSLSHAVIFKSGDDLRQDMLTLQVIGLMMHAWTSEGLDLRMTPYSCLATGNQMGLIEVVRNAKTIYSIQRRAKLGAIQVDSSQLYKWIKDNNPGERLDKAIETFTRSCAGYCVATFVLGIGDRHPDNIMVNEEGQIFHIDFGHFLGNFKKKFGIQRERVPFVLTLDFLKVIAAGADNPKDSHRFERFQELCGKAYLALRKHTKLIMSLFALLLSTGLPELQTYDDISFLRKTFAVDMTETEALQFFQNQFHEAYGGAWTTKLDWFFHSVKHR